MPPEPFILLVILIFSIILHEVAHGYAANALGDPTARLAGRLTLNPIPHIDPVGSIMIPALLALTQSPIFFGWARPVPYNPYNLRHGRFGEAFVALAGSATNISIAIVFGLVVRYGGSVFSPAALKIAGIVVLMNLFLGLFNLIPFPPLDGFTALRALLPWDVSRHFHAFENALHGLGFISLLAFLIIFTSIVAEPFGRLVVHLALLIIGPSAVYYP